MKSRCSIRRLAMCLTAVTLYGCLGYLFAGQRVADDLPQPNRHKPGSLKRTADTDPQSTDDSPQAKGYRRAKRKGATHIARTANGVWWYSITGSRVDDFGRAAPLRIIGDYGKEVTLEKETLGALFLDVDSGRFVYHVFDGGDDGESAVGTPAKDRPLLGIAAGFDGEMYWEAFFVKRIHDKGIFGRGFYDSASWAAGEVEVYRSLRTRMHYGWFLHDLFEYIDCDSWDHASIGKAFTAAAPYGREVTDKDKDLLDLARSSGFVGDGSFFSYRPWVTKNGWLQPAGRGNREYLVQLDQEVPAVKMSRVRYLGSFLGVVPLLPRTHFFVRQGQLSEFPVTMFSFQHYVDADTVIRHVDAVPPENEKDN